MALVIEYRPRPDTDDHYGFSYRETRRLYREFVAMTDEEFFGAQLPDAMHLACFIAYIKEIPAEDVVGDQGLLHEMIHTMTTTDMTDADRANIRKMFYQLLELA